MINKYDGFIIDLDGTIYLDDKIIDGADKVINTIIKQNKEIVFVSNKTTGTIEEYYDLLKTNELNVKISMFLNSTIVLRKYLKNYFEGSSFFAIGEEIFIKEIEKCGLVYDNNPKEVDFVIITLDRTLNYSKLEIAAKSLDNGAKFFAANIDNTCPVEGGEILDAGSTISALEKRTNRKLQKHFGKPSEEMLSAALEKIKVKPEKCLIIGDRLETDIAMGNKFNIDTALVRTGVTNYHDLNDKYKPTYVFSSIADLI